MESWLDAPLIHCTRLGKVVEVTEVASQSSRVKTGSVIRMRSVLVIASAHATAMGMHKRSAVSPRWHDWLVSRDKFPRWYLLSFLLERALLTRQSDMITRPRVSLLLPNYFLMSLRL